MLTLRELQAGFVSDMHSDRLNGLENVIRSGRFSANALMQVYRNNHSISLTEALRGVYATVDGLVGKGFFDYAAHLFIQKHPSRGGNLHDFGRKFPGFLSSMLEAAHLPYLHDVAELDWLCHEVFHEADSVTLDVDKLQAFEPGDYGSLVFDLKPAMRFLNTEFSIADIRLALGVSSEEQFTGVIRYDRGPEYLVIIRTSLEIELLSLAADEFYFLKTLGEGEVLESAVEAGLNHAESFDLPTTLQTNFSRGIFTNVRLYL